MKPLLALIVALAALRPAVAEACKKRHETPFELFDRATTVAFVRVVRTPSNSDRRLAPGDVELAVTTLVKGAAATTLVAQESETSCRGAFLPGRDALVFLGADGFPVGAHDGHLARPAPWRPVIAAWARATTPAARVEVLVEAIAGAEPAVANEALIYLVDEPALLDLVSVAQTRRIADGLAALPKDPTAVMLLARLGDPGAPRRANVRFWAQAARRFQAVREFAQVTDPAALAAVIGAARREQDPRASAAMERCERLHGKRLVGIWRYFGGAGSAAAWQDLAERCRTGTAQ
jgi:hypothetical protein